MIQLHIRDNCPYCKKVLKAIDALPLKEGVDYVVIDSGPGTAGRETVLKTGGKAMVPFLVDGDHSMYESDDIIVYLQKKFSAG